MSGGKTNVSNEKSVKILSKKRGMVQQELLPASSLWRKNVLHSGRRYKKELIENIHINDRSIEHISTAVSHNKTNHVVLFDTSPKRDAIRIVKLNKEDKKTQSLPPTKNSNDTKWKIVGEGIQENANSIKSASWYDGMLLASGLDGQIYMYNCDPLSTGGEVDIELQETYTITKLKGLREGSFSIGSCSTSTSIKGVSINTLSPSTFACVENQSFHIWDVANPVQPIVSYRASDSPMKCLDWSRHSRHHCAVGGDDNTIRVLDQRQLSSYGLKNKSPVSWSTSQCQGNINCVSWHPFVPYWLASATDSGAIEIFDLRSISKPVVSFYAHNGPVTNINWCPSHSELMVSSGFDCSFNMWNISMPPQYLLYQRDEGGPYTYGSFFLEDGYNNFSVNQNGDVTYSSISQKFMNPFIHSKFQDSNEIAEKRVERLIYHREFVSGFEKAIILANKHSRNNQIEKAHTLLSLCFQTTLEDTLSDVLKSNAPKVDMRKEFIKNMESYSYFIPPLYYEKFNTKLTTSLMTKIKDLKISLDIQKHIKNCSGEELLEIEREILMTLRGDHLSIRLETIIDVVLVLMNYDIVKCYNFVNQLSDIFKNKLNFISPILRVLFYPSIFSSPSSPTDNLLGSSNDSFHLSSSTDLLIKSPLTKPGGSSISSSPLPTTTKASNQISPPERTRGNTTVSTTSPPTTTTTNTGLNRSNASIALKEPSEIEESKINEHFGTHEAITQQISYMRDFTKILMSPTPVSDGSNDQEDIIDFSSKNRPPIVASMSFNRIYLSILAESFIYDQFFIVLLNLLPVCDGFEFNMELNELYEIFTPDFLAYMKASQQRDKVRPWDSERFSTPLLTAISILSNVFVANIPTDFYETLSSCIPIFIQELDNCFVSTLQSPDPTLSDLSGKQQVQQYKITSSI
ncbi:hypothetical protein DFA_04234 [Cavenderia fasciculata]|uniref:WD40 repeat-containing protein n=1 Tax=Cavenderia fasciculata TaxID=261658 RepID=F4PVA0_CACFS|nr:uncharacterized protein DFA_04234 [Cavenderia fasciculata]EGG20463.1 hypothetical protein DFA_04234 [Cavenderia fasciculata]|eukprot:XP_004358232.1 hypothetical protein DFA_04234 [Cavenderia fasciculata]